MPKRAAVKLLAASEDRARLQGVLQQLRNQGLRISDAGSTLGKNDVVLAVLSEHFYADEELKARLFDHLALGAENILPLNLGNCPVPREIMDLLFARNIITPDDRDDAQVAERILAAIPEKKNYLPVLFSAVAAVLLIFVGGFLWQSGRTPEPTEPVIVETEPVVYPFGITAEDLEKIQNVVIIGDYFAYHTFDDIRHTAVWPEIYDFAYEAWDDTGRHWYSNEDGHEYTLTRYEDLRFLELMPNLRRLRMVLVDVDPEMLPDLSESVALTYVSMHSCTVSDLEWMAAKYLTSVDITDTPVGDYSPLTRCGSLEYAYIDGFGRYPGDVSDLAPPNLRELSICNLPVDAVDLTKLSGSGNLKRLSLSELPITDLQFLEGMQHLNALILDNNYMLQDISAVASLPGLHELRLRRCDSVTDYTPISGCNMLQIINIERDHWIPVDSSFLSGLVGLRDIGLYGLNLNNLDFLGTLNSRNPLSMGFAGEIQDYSGLALRDHYQFLHVNPRSNGTPFGDYALVAPHLRNANVGHLDLFNCTNLDLAELPTVSGTLSIYGGDLEDLTGLSNQSTLELELRNMQYLRSLNGIEGMDRLYSSLFRLNIVGCPRLTDYTALNRADLSELNLVDMYTYPDFSSLTLKSLRLEGIAQMEDLHCLEALDPSRFYQFKFPGLNELKDLSVLQNFHGGTLCVPPQVADQAQELVEQGNFKAYEVSYPEFGWNPLNEEVLLLSLEELETLPKVILGRVSRVWIAGDEIIDPNRYEVRNEWVDDHPVPALYEYHTGELRMLEEGSVTDFSILQDLTHVRDLRLFNQPLSSLEGIQNFTDLKFFEARFCENLTDVSALFTQQTLEEVYLNYNPIQSIQGVQNLPRLRWLGIAWTQVSDISPLAEMDYTQATEWNGFALEMENTPIRDFSPLSAIPSISYLGIYGVPAETWMPQVQDAQVRCFGAQMGNDEMLAEFVRQHPELEEMYIEEAYQLTDLTPLLTLEHLYQVHIWSSPEQAVSSLDGCEYGFGLYVN